MAVTSDTHDLKTLVLSFHPIISIETVEAQRLRSRLLAVARGARLLLVGTVTQGLTQSTGDRSRDRGMHHTE